MKKTPRTISVILLAVLILSACNLPSKNPASQDPNAAMTAAAQTIAAQLTMVAPLNTATIPLIVPNTNTPVSVPPTAIIPSATSKPPTATPTCDLGKFITDVSIPDGTVMTPGQAFTKTWRLQNIGACSWTGYSLVFDTGDAMGGAASSAIGTTPSNGTIDVSINLTAPTAPGNYRGYWRVRSAAGVLFPIVSGYQGRSFYVDIKVQNPATATYTPTATNTAIVFSVTTVTFTITGSCAANFNLSVTITTNSAGTVNLHRVWNDGGSDSTPKTLVFSAAGSQTIDYGTVSVPSPGSSWTDIYIDSPNHQQFGRANFTCP
jgi:hypothetical protein